MTMSVVDPLAVAIFGFASEVRKNPEPAGLSYESNRIRDLLALGRCTLPVFKGGSLVKNGSSIPSDMGDFADKELRYDLFDKDDEKYEKFLFRLNPSDFKNQDHYKVLGLSKLRYMATMEEIRYCYRAKVLKHHPDKKKHRGISIESEEYFTCITKAYEQLGTNEQKRLAYDSVDNKFDDEIPTDKSVTKENFFQTFPPIFERNSRWSIPKPVPLLGTQDSSRKEVEAFYNFWFDFKSWREFSYLDEEAKESAEDRYERREMEKINRVERERRKKEETRRIRKLVDLSYAKDPRIAQFKKDDQNEKERVKEEKRKVKLAKQEEEERLRKEAEEAERKKIEEAEQLEREQKEKLKKEKDAAKKAMTVQRKRFKKLAETASFWTEDPKEKLEEMERVERLCLSTSVDQLSELCEKIENLSVGEDIKQTIGQFEEDLKNAKMQEVEAKKADKDKENDEKNVNVGNWTSEELQLLIKASNTYPSGTSERWTLIAAYINEHRKNKSGPEKTAKQVIKQVKAVQSMNVKLPEATQNKLADGVVTDDETWSAQEQKVFETALKQYPASLSDRWDKIANDVGTKSKKACIRRFKELVQMVKNRKTAES
ncbi:hypothetical protein WR25_27022 [Diploscapter pachys]|uniref:Uncharacterized protein n=1 Tax=Diploscapter pachys TaxID=2018661 RepID=A0A2A2KDF4_9BILA|nr:hypothetical protein WR25_27022 [Diploscapter pachys]